MEATGKIYIRGNYIFLNEVDKGNTRHQQFQSIKTGKRRLYRYSR
jgi:hypothetical protein